MGGVVTAGGGHGWETRVVAALGRPGAAMTVVRRCADMADVLAVASTGQVAVCLVAADLRRMDSESVHQLAQFGVSVVAIHRAGDERAATLLARIGVARALSDDADTDEIIAAVIRAAGTSGEDTPGGTSALVGDPSAALPAPHRDGQTPSVLPATEPPADESDAVSDRRDRAARHRSSDVFRRRRDGRGAGAAPTGRAASHADGPAGEARLDRHPPEGPAVHHGRVVAVWGPVGAPGRSTVAMGLADRLAAGGDRVMLVDADVYGGILANAFGLLDESAGLAGACRLAAHGRLDAAELAQLSWAISDRLALLTGIARADRWPELRPSAVPMVLDIARSRADIVIVDCAAILETDEEITFDTMAPRRNGATIAALRDADMVLAVGSADPSGMERLARGMAELTAAMGEAQSDGGNSPGAAATSFARPVHVVLNRVRPTAASPTELIQAVRRYCGRDPVALLPEDRPGCDLAWRRGVPIAAVAPKSPLARGLGELALRLEALLRATSFPTATGRRTQVTAVR